MSSKVLHVVILTLSPLMLSGCATQFGSGIASYFGQGRQTSDPLGEASGDLNSQQRIAGVEDRSAADNTNSIPVQLASAAQSRHDVGLMTLQPGQNLDQRLSQAPGRVIIDFYADWCGPCQKQAKTLHDLAPLAEQHNATIVKVDVEQHPELQQRFKVAALPTLVVLDQGKLVARQKGLTSARQLTGWITGE